MQEFPEALKFYQKLTESEKKQYLNWIYSAKHEDTKADRIVKMIDRLMLKKKFREVN
jgi:uncharacterized protein YdeI (YjbR/CyaY-like superfamily)